MQNNEPLSFAARRDAYLPRSNPTVIKIENRWKNSRIDSLVDVLGKTKESCINEPVVQKQARDEFKAEPIKNNVGKTVMKDKAGEQKVQTKQTRQVQGRKQHKDWEFGKKKSFIAPKNNKKNNDAAILIERFVRGWWTRINFRIRLLEHRLETKDERTRAAIEKVHGRYDQRKQTMRYRLEEKSKKELSKMTKEQRCAEEGQQLIAFLRKENRKLREKNEKLHNAITVLKDQNERLEHANDSTDSCFTTLNEHAKHIQDTYDKLSEVVPKYRAGVEALKGALSDRNQYCETEHRIKLMYVKCVGMIVEKMEENDEDKALIDSIVELCMETEDADNIMLLPEKNSVESEHALSDEDSELDQYTVASMG